MPNPPFKVPTVDLPSPPPTLGFSPATLSVRLQPSPPSPSISAWQELQLRLESSARDIAALSSRVRDLDEDRSVGLEALEAAVAALKEAMAGKADAAKVRHGVVFRELL